ncbi:MAG: hypothetical protein ABI843_10170 [Dokdonella sp.]
MHYSDPTIPHILKFDARLWQSALPEPCCGDQPIQLQTLTSWVAVIANWGTHPKMIQIALWHQSRDPRQPSLPDPYLSGSVPVNCNTPWDWRYTHSGLYPGAMNLTMTAESIAAYCGFSVPTLVLNQDTHYSIDLQQLYSCMNSHHLFDEPMPAATFNLPITVVAWANEGSGINGGLWTDVHNMRMVGATGAHGESDDSATPAAGMPDREVAQYGPGTEAIRRALEDGISTPH